MVYLVNLEAFAQLNGQCGTLLSYDEERKRWQVDLKDDPMTGVKNVLPSNLSKVPPLKPQATPQRAAEVDKRPLCETTTDPGDSHWISGLCCRSTWFFTQDCISTDKWQVVQDTIQYARQLQWSEAERSDTLLVQVLLQNNWSNKATALDFLFKMLTDRYPDYVQTSHWSKSKNQHQ